MSDRSAIDWTDATWNPIRGCSRVSEGCRHCFAERIAGRFVDFDSYAGLAKTVGGEWRWTGEVRFVEEALDLPLHWRRPRRIFVNSMSDLFHEKVPDEWIAAIFGVMAAAPQHTFQVLTKRPERMHAWWAWLNDRGGLGPYIRSIRIDGDRMLPNLFGAVQRTEVYRGKTIRAGDDPWMQVFNAAACTGAGPLPNVWLGVSVEDQATADERIPLLLQTPAALRWVSYEPALAAVDFKRWLPEVLDAGGVRRADAPSITGTVQGETRRHPETGVGQPSHLDWVVIGGESGPGARPFDLAWARSVIAQCRATGVPVFCKQVGSRAVWSLEEYKYRHGERLPARDLIGTRARFLTGDRKGGDPSEWQEDLRVREYPRVDRQAAL